MNKITPTNEQLRLALELSQYAQLQAEQEVELQKKLHEVCIVEKIEKCRDRDDLIYFLERYAKQLEDENKRLRKTIDDALVDVSMVKDGAEDWIEFVEEKLTQALEGGGSGE